MPGDKMARADKEAHMKLTVIGAGPGGYEAAVYAAKRGAQVTLVENERVGGTCLNVGCIPTKSLLAASDVLHTVKNARAFGVTAENIGIDIAVVVEHKGKIVEGLTKGVGQILSANGVRLMQGTGRLLDGTATQVTGADGNISRVDSDYVLLATGSQVAVPEFISVDGETVITSDQVLALRRTPASMVIVGGGVIGCEIGQFFARMGTAVTIVEMMPHLLPLEDADTAGALDRQFRRDKIKSICGVGIASVEKTEAGARATLQDGRVLEAEKVLVAVGRKPRTGGIGLQEAGVELDAKGFVRVDAHMKTTLDTVYAAGDIVNTPQLAHLASKEGMVAVDNMLGGAKQVRYGAVPRCVYTDPEIASVGATQAQLDTAGTSYRVGRFDMVANGKAKAAGKTDGFCKVLAGQDDILLGAAIAGAHATDMLSLLTLAIDQKLTVAEVGDIIFPHPTLGEVVMEALHDVHGMSIHKI